MSDVVNWLRTQLHADVADVQDDSQYQILKAKHTDYQDETLSRAEAGLTILHWHEGAHSCKGRWAYDAVPHTDEDDGCWTVRMLAYGYRNRKGWLEEWRP